MHEIKELNTQLKSDDRVIAFRSYEQKEKQKKIFAA